MDIKESAELTAFRTSVREWVSGNIPVDIRQDYKYSGMEHDDPVDRWFQTLAEKNWLAFRWPEEFGGPGFSPAEQMVFVDEFRDLGAPVPTGFGLGMVGPLISGVLCPYCPPSND